MTQHDRHQTGREPERGRAPNRSNPDAQEQVVERSPGTPDPTSDVTGERTSVTNTQTSSGLSGGSPAAGPHKTPERANLETPANRPNTEDDLTDDPALKIKM